VLFRSAVRRVSWHWARLAGLGVGLCVFFLGGLLVSAKIGGGNNIHNLDAFLALLLVIAAYTCFGRFAPDGEQTALSVYLPGRLAALAAILPLLFYLPNTTLQLPKPNPNYSQVVNVLQGYVDRAEQSGQGEVIFMGERQLLPLGVIHGATLVPEYEKWFLMEMAMAGNDRYYADFDRDINSQRFGLIVSEPLQQWSRGKNYPFGEENDRWVMRVSEQILANYQLAAEYPQFNFDIYIPKPR
jgi:hypothetical protein